MNARGTASPQGRLRGASGVGDQPPPCRQSWRPWLSSATRQKSQPPPQTFSPHAWEASSISPGGCRARKADTTTRAGLARSWTGSDGVRYRGMDEGGSACGGSGLNRAGRALTGAASPGCWSSSITWRCVKWCEHEVQLTPGFSWGLQKGVKGGPFNLGSAGHSRRHIPPGEAHPCTTAFKRVCVSVHV